MKRSEMVYKLAVWFLENQGGYKADEFAHKFLMRCEELGMLPPEIKEYVEIPPHNILGAGFKVGHNVCKWEPEDETK